MRGSPNSSLSVLNWAQCSRQGLPSAEQRSEHLLHPAGYALCSAPQGTIGLHGHHGTLLARGHPIVNCWSTFGQPVGHHWLSWPPGHTAGSRSHCWTTLGQPVGLHWPTGAHCWLVVSFWSTIGQLLVNQDPSGVVGHQGTLLARGQLLINHRSRRAPLASLATGAYFQLMVNHWPTTAQPGYHWCPWPPGHTAGSRSVFGQPMVSCWLTRTLLAFLATGAHCWLAVSCWATSRTNPGARSSSADGWMRFGASQLDVEHPHPTGPVPVSPAPVPVSPAPVPKGSSSRTDVEE